MNTFFLKSFILDNCSGYYEANRRRLTTRTTLYGGSSINNLPVNECLNVCMYNKIPWTYTRACFCFHGEGKRDRKTVLDSKIDVPVRSFLPDRFA